MRKIHRSTISSISSCTGLALTAAAMLLMTAPMQAQQGQQFRASITGNPNDTRGKCTIEAVIDTVVEIEIRGDTAMMYNVGGGQPPRWVRFQCSAPMPLVPANFRFRGVDGRGQQSLVRPPVNGDTAVIRIEDPRGGTEGYTFDMEWDGAGPVPNGGNRGGFGGNRGGFGNNQGGAGNNPGGFGNNQGGFGKGRGVNRRMTAEEAVQICEDAVIDQALDRLRVPAIVLRRTAIDDGPGRRDWVIGNFETRRGRDRDIYRFQCSVDFDSGRVRSADFQPGR
ncbi:MAG: hypothetical protein ABL995_04100 [Bryobacteraceae bacterium]